ADFQADRADFPKERIDAVTDLDVNDDVICAGLGKWFDEYFRARTHEVDIKRHARERANDLHDLRAEGDVRHEMAIHDVEMEPVGFGAVGAHGLSRESSKIRGEQRRRDNHRGKTNEMR